MAAETSPVRKKLVTEATVFLSLLLIGVLLLPVAVYFVGQSVFGAYAGDGYGEFFTALARKLLAFEWVAWFLVLSPYLAVQTLRVTALGWRKSATM